MKNWITVLFTSLTFALAACSTTEQADLVLTNGKILTVDSNMTMVEAIAVKGDTIAALGTSEEIEQYIGEATKVIDLKGEFAMPGIVESHAHIWGLGESKINIDLMETTTWDEIVYMVAEAARQAPPGEWIVGDGWHQEKWNMTPEPNVNGYPFHDKLSEASPNNPVLLNHASRHAIFANQKAMEIAGVDSTTEAPAGGKILKDSFGNPIGVFQETAEDLITSKYQEYLDNRTPEEEKEWRKRVIRLATEECLKQGITSFHDAGSSFEQVDVLKEMADEDSLDVRLFIMLYEDNQSIKDKIADYKLHNYGNHHLTVGAIKRYSDGALGSRGAWLLEDYSDLEGHAGLNVTPMSLIEESAQIALDNGLQLCTHAIGDRANREVLDLYEEAFKDKQTPDSLRWRVEHAQHLHPDDIPRFAELGVIAAVQCVHCTSDASFVEKRLGEWRARTGAYPWRSLIDSGAILCNGTDAPVEKVDPMPSFYASVTRNPKNMEPFYPEQCMTREEAVRSYTINGAYAEFADDIKGSLEKGKLADIVVLSNNLLTCGEEEILNTEVLYTIADGKVKYEGNK